MISITTYDGICLTKWSLAVPVPQRGNKINIECPVFSGFVDKVSYNMEYSDDAVVAITVYVIDESHWPQ
jgi:hypothetical protein